MNFLGFEVNVIDDADVDDAIERGETHVYMVSRVEDDDPAMGSPELLARRKRTPCERCSEICWIDPLGYEQVARMQHVIVCIRCLLKQARQEKAAERK